MGELTVNCVIPAVTATNILTQLSDEAVAAMTAEIRMAGTRSARRSRRARFVACL